MNLPAVADAVLKPRNVAIFLAILAVIFLGLAQITPWYTDYAAFHALVGAHYGDTATFHDARRQYGTHKWLYADMGYLTAAWAVLVALLATTVCRRGWRGALRGSHRAVIVIPLAVLCYLSIGVALFMSFIGHPMGRWTVPVWADSVGIPLMAIKSLMVTVVAPICGLVVLPVLARRPAAPSLIIWPKPIGLNLLVSVIYLPVLLMASAMIAAAGSEGGWAFTTSGALLMWLALNARALWITPNAPLSAKHPGATGQ